MDTSGVKYVAFQPGFSLCIDDKDGLLSNQIQQGVHSAVLLSIISNLAAHQLLKILDYYVTPATPGAAQTSEPTLPYYDG